MAEQRYKIDYQERDKDGNVLKNFIDEYCFSKIFGSGIEKNTATILLYTNKLEITPEEFERYLQVLNQIGFKNTYVGKVDTYPGVEKITAKNPCWVITVNTADYEHLAVLNSALTLLRLPYDWAEGHCGKTPYKIALNTLKCLDAVKGINPFHALVMAHIMHGNGGHHLCHNSPNMVLFTFEQFVAQAAKQNLTIYKGKGGKNHLWEAWGAFATFDGEQDKNDPAKLYKQLTQEKDNTLKVYVVGGDNNYTNWLPEHKFVKNVKQADLVVFTGGEDVTPNIYGEEQNPRTGNNPARDEYEAIVFKQAQKLGKKMLGVCREGQFLCAMSGGKLVQHQQNPAYIHKITLQDGREINITSTHHQAQFPFNLKKWDYKVIAYTNGISKMHEGGKGEELNPPVEAEIVYYKKTNALGIQGHPEMTDDQHKYPEDLAEVKNIFQKFMEGAL